MGKSTVSVLMRIRSAVAPPKGVLSFHAEGGVYSQF